MTGSHKMNLEKIDRSIGNDDLLFVGPLLKLARADQHVGDLRKRLDHHERRLKNDDRKRLKGQKVTPKPFDRIIPTIIGDAIHNMRSCLDHAFKITVRLNGGNITRHTDFPFRKEEHELNRHLAKAKENGNAPSEEIIAQILSELQPFEGGKQDLYGLSMLSNTDKHSVLIPTAAKATIGSFKAVSGGGKVSNVEIIGDLHIVLPVDGGVSPIGPKGSDAVLQFGDQEVVPEKGSGTKFSTVFASDQPYAGEGVMETLEKLHAVCVKAIKQMHVTCIEDLMREGRLERTFVSIDPESGEQRIVLDEPEPEPELWKRHWNDYLRRL